MIHVTAAVVANGRPDVFGHRVDVAQQVFDALRLQLGIFLERSIEIRHIRVVMFPVMDFHGFGIDMRLERVERIRKRR